MRPAVAVRGRLEFDSASQGSLHLAGYAVAARAIGGDVMGVAPLAISDQTGEFLLPGLPPGSYVLTVAGKPNATIESISVAGRESRFNEFTLKADMTVEVSVKLTSVPGKIVGTVAAANPDAFKRSWVYLLPRENFPSVAAAIVSGRMRRAVVAANGAFSFDNVASGDYLVAADDRQQDVWAVESVLKVLRADAVPVTARPGGIQNLRLRLPRK
jgi:hypothetical protein